MCVCVCVCVQSVMCKLSSKLYKKENSTVVHFIKYIYQNYMKCSLKYCFLKEIAIWFNNNLQITSEYPVCLSDVLLV